MRVVVIGASGNFGARICRALHPDSAIEVIPAGRSAAAARLDIRSPGFERDLSALRPGLVIHCAGPFQGGAHPCMGFLELKEFEPEFARLGIRSAVDEYDA